ncbi:type II toxin-antitoxin system YafQ family toxin [Hyphomicrobium sp.]|uniref:type II toxin-antitoxin system YafQ family toxin n=1 Tax=Hyphomicrobium sp. TaxID=82 RepID=UPI002FE3EE95
MRTIEWASAFKRDFKRVSRSMKNLEALLDPVVRTLAADEPLAERFKDHALSGNWAGYRDCHVRPDLVLIYGKPDADTLRLARLGSHSELF